MGRSHSDSSTKGRGAVIRNALKYYWPWAFMILPVWWWFCLPKPLFQSGYSTILLDKDDQLLGARLADDGQWRFPGDELEVPETFKQAIIHFEDKRFF